MHPDGSARKAQSVRLARPRALVLRLRLRPPKWRPLRLLAMGQGVWIAPLANDVPGGGKGVAANVRLLRLRKDPRPG